MSIITVLLNDFVRIADQMESGVANVMANGANQVVAAADPRTPVRTGELRSNKTIESSSDGFSVTWNSDHAAYQEFGTSRGIAPKRFAAGAMDEVGPSIVQELAAVVGGL